MSALKRFFVDKIEEMTELSGEEFEHAKNVLRLTVGDEVILLDNSGAEYTAVIATVEKKRMLLNVLREETGGREAETDVYKRGRNAHGVSAPKSASVGEYRRATGMEALFGHLYLLGEDGRLNELFNIAYPEE